MHPTGELLGYFLVTMGLFCRKKHVNIEITGSRGIRTVSIFNAVKQKFYAAILSEKLSQTAIIT